MFEAAIRQAYAQAARLHAVEFEHVAEEAVAPARVIEYLAAVGPYLLGLDAAISNQLTEPLDPCQRGPEFVAHDRKELGLRAVDLFERGVGAALRVECLREPVLGFADGRNALGHDQQVLQLPGCGWYRGCH